MTLPAVTYGDDANNEWSPRMLRNTSSKRAASEFGMETTCSK